ncbi:hypothetical protein ACWT_4814 [Actinoplanes sp. SE50]|uniref:hypothetical protein n=1 Tax=unclassified Actinoplanes TaxID=2626549 RepID=UPI00023EC301|nr:MULTISPECIES: hypothetical protein [unclassified Actinoplanes]AEV85833.1 hypothetical protein ACPL_4944 [Actinoplanes sp. SE50/110]ATO84229.1 hypothetical protein ACWT_4814 [Actinoplanes sp. SE50]SLM01639.1 hypothetical protein ACSP50_4875 [Actinoplanes sp. SE50/110]
MSTEQQAAGRHPTDEPDGTPAYAASLRRPGESVAGAPAEEPEPDEAPTGAGYDENAVSGDSTAYRPD